MKISNFKKIVSIGFFAAFLAVFLSAGTAQAGFWDWFNVGGDSQQAAVRAKTYTLRVSKSGYGGSYGNITSSDKKINCGFDCSERYASAQTVTLTAISKSNNYSFDRWTGGGCSGSGSCVVNVNKANGTVSVRAIFKKNSSDKKGITASGDTPTTSDSASLTAKTGSALDITSTSASLNGTINPKGENVSVYFKYRKESESAEATKTTDWMSTGSRSNDFTASVKISDLSSETKYVYRFYAYNHTSGKTVYGDLKSFKTLSGSSNSSSVQSSSSSVSSGASSSSSSVQQYTLKVKVTGAGQIKGYLSEDGSEEKIIDCKKKTDGKLDDGNKTCTAKIDSGKSVRLEITNSSTQYEFAIWADNCRGKTIGGCTLTMTGNKTVSATFNKKGSADKETVSVSVRKTGKGIGKIISVYSSGENSGKEDGRINCGNNCSENYEKICENTEGGRGCSLAYFKAVAEKGSTFSGWGGGCLTFKNVKDQCYVHLDGDKTINANFNEGSGNTEGKYYGLTVTVSEGGKVVSTDNKINCTSGNSPCTKSYGKNGTVTLKATPNSGYIYAGGNNICLGQAKGTLTCKVKMTKNQNVTVNFKASGTSSSSSSSKSSSSSAGSYSTVTGSASNITSTSATLNGTITPNGNSLSYVFAYRKNSDSSSKTKYAPSTNTYTSIGGTSGDISVSADTSGLSSGTKYVYRLYVYNSVTKKTTGGFAKYFTTL